MAIDSNYLYRAEDELNALSRDLLDQETQTCAMRTDLLQGTDDAAGFWKGPRATSVLRDANDYLRSIKEYPDALISARGTLKRWACVANDTARALAVQEAIVEDWGDRSSVQPDAEFDPGRNPFQDEFEASAEMDRIRATWARTCTRHAGELDGAIAAIVRANNATFLTIDPGRADALGAQLWLKTLSGPNEVRIWWNGLSDAERLALLMANPGALGGLDGLPASIRDIANRTQLMNDLNRLEELESKGRLADGNERELENIRNVLEQLKDGDSYIDPVTGDSVPCQLYIYEPAAFGGDGRVGISTGDLDGADNIAITVPGFKSNVAGMTIGDGQNLYDETRWAGDGDVAVLTWYGYDAPDWSGTSLDPSNPGVPDAGGVTDDFAAEEGGALLIEDVDGINAIRDPNSTITVVGHSYGSTTVASAADDGMDVDNVVLIGSPGTGDADSASNFENVEHVYAGSASNDGISWLPPLGPDPVNEDWDGGIRFEAENGLDSWNWPMATPSHNAYFDDGTESLYNMSSVVAGDGDEIVSAPDRHSQSPIQVGMGGPFGTEILPEITFHPPTHDPEGDRDVTAGHTHQPLQPGGPSHQGGHRGPNQ